MKYKIGDILVKHVINPSTFDPVICGLWEVVKIEANSDTAEIQHNSKKATIHTLQRGTYWIKSIYKSQATTKIDALDLETSTSPATPMDVINATNDSL